MRLALCELCLNQTCHLGCLSFFSFYWLVQYQNCVNCLYLINLADCVLFHGHLVTFSFQVSNLFLSSIRNIVPIINRWYNFLNLLFIFTVRLWKLFEALMIIRCDVQVNWLLISINVSKQTDISTRMLFIQRLVGRSSRSLAGSIAN